MSFSFLFNLFFFNCLTNTKISDIKWMTSLYLYRPSYSNGLIFLDVRAFQCVLLSIVQQKIVLHVKFTTTNIKLSRMFFSSRICLFFSHSFVYFFVTIGGTRVLKTKNIDGLVEKDQL